MTDTARPGHASGTYSLGGVLDVHRLGFGAMQLVVATKAGLTRPGPGVWVPNGRPEYLRGQVEQSLATLGVERIDLLQLHRVDPKVPLADSVGALAELQTEGKIVHIGLSQVSVVELRAA